MFAALVYQSRVVTESTDLSHFTDRTLCRYNNSLAQDFVFANDLT
jgi:hypothetical protein